MLCYGHTVSGHIMPEADPFANCKGAEPDAPHKPCTAQS
jgi:hypothetical protein